MPFFMVFYLPFAAKYGRAKFVISLLRQKSLCTIARFEIIDKGQGSATISSVFTNNKHTFVSFFLPNWVKYLVLGSKKAKVGDYTASEADANKLRKPN